MERIHLCDSPTHFVIPLLIDNVYFTVASLLPVVGPGDVEVVSTGGSQE